MLARAPPDLCCEQAGFQEYFTSLSLTILIIFFTFPTAKRKKDPGVIVDSSIKA